MRNCLCTSCIAKSNVLVMFLADFLDTELKLAIIKRYLRTILSKSDYKIFIIPLLILPLSKIRTNVQTVTSEPMDKLNNVFTNTFY